MAVRLRRAVLILDQAESDVVGQSTPNVAALYEHPALPHQFHNVRAPGGYEFWRFSAEDAKSDLRVEATVGQGWPVHPAYWRAYSRYLRRPTRVAPPLPADWLCQFVEVYRGGRLICRRWQYLPAKSFQITNGDTVELGASRVLLGQEPVLLTMTSKGDPSFGVNLEFHAQVAGVVPEQAFISRHASGADHRWQVSHPLCRVSGKIQFGGEIIPLEGRGWHDHFCGTGPIGIGLKRWFHGRALLDGCAIAFQFVRPRDRQLPDGLTVIRADADGANVIDVPLSRMRFSRRTLHLLGYPASMSLGIGSTGDLLQLSNPRVVDGTRLSARIQYDAAIDGDPMRAGNAWCETASMHRLGWPLVGRIVGREAVFLPDDQ